MMKSKSVLISLLVLVGMLAGCQSTNKQPTMTVSNQPTLQQSSLAYIHQ